MITFTFYGLAVILTGVAVASIGFLLYCALRETGWHRGRGRWGDE